MCTYKYALLLPCRSICFYRLKSIHFQVQYIFSLYVSPTNENGRKNDPWRFGDKLIHLDKVILDGKYWIFLLAKKTKTLIMLGRKTIKTFLFGMSKNWRLKTWYCNYGRFHNWFPPIFLPFLHEKISDGQVITYMMGFLGDQWTKVRLRHFLGKLTRRDTLQGNNAISYFWKRNIIDSKVPW